MTSNDDDLIIFLQIYLQGAGFYNIHLPTRFSFSTNQNLARNLSYAQPCSNRYIFHFLFLHIIDKEMNPDVVTMDIMMPDMDGIQAVRGIKAINAGDRDFNFNAVVSGVPHF